MNKWTKANEKENGGCEYNRDSRYAATDYSGNAVNIRLHYFYNGSGSKYFGGASKWPGVSMNISFPVNSEKLRDKFAKELRILIDKFVEKNQLTS